MDRHSTSYHRHFRTEMMAIREELKGCTVQKRRLNLEAGPAWATSHLLLSLCVSEDIVPVLPLTDGGH